MSAESDVLIKARLSALEAQVADHQATIPLLLEAQKLLAEALSELNQAVRNLCR